MSIKLIKIRTIDVSIIMLLLKKLLGRLHYGNLQGILSKNNGIVLYDGNLKFVNLFVNRLIRIFFLPCLSPKYQKNRKIHPISFFISSNSIMAMLDSILLPFRKNNVCSTV
jgi:hypothetical protein